MDITAFIVNKRDSALTLGDYNTYRAQLTRRLLTLRRKLGRTTGKNAKNAARPPLSPADIQRDQEFIHLVLLTAERAWAHAMHMKSTHLEDTAKGVVTGCTRSHIVSRLGKAYKHANELVTLLSDKENSGAADQDVLEAQAYAFSLRGAAEFEKQSQGARANDSSTTRWDKCLEYLSAARIIYGSLLQSKGDDAFREILAGTIDPSIRYAAYKASIPRTLAVPTIARQHFPRHDENLVSAVNALDPGALSEEVTDTATENKVPDSISWRSRTVNIVDAAIGQALAAAAAAEERLSLIFSNAGDKSTTDDTAAAYDGVLSASQEAADATRHAIEELEKEHVDESDKRIQDLRITSLAVNYELISWRIGRNRVLLGTHDGAMLDEVDGTKQVRRRDGTSRPAKQTEGTGKRLARLRQRVALYDSVLQSLDFIKDIRGAARDADFIGEIEGKRAYFQALRCLNIGYSHALLSDHTTALALFARASSLAQVFTRAVDVSVPLSKPVKLEIRPSQASALEQRLRALVSQYRGIVTLHRVQADAIKSSEGAAQALPPLVMRLGQYPETPAALQRLVAYPPELEPVPVKPLFLDVAWNYIEYPGRTAEAVIEGRAGTSPEPEPRGAEEKKPAKKGWFGFGR